MTTMTTTPVGAARATVARVPAQRAPRGPAATGRGRGAAARPARPPMEAPTSRAALGLLRQAAGGLAEAHRVADPLLRYPAAYLAALRAAAAVLAVRARPQPRRGSTRNVWQLLAEVAPEFAEWAVFFASCSDTRAAAEAGIARLVGQREADDLLRQSEEFVGLVTVSVPLR
jgi:HEPN superfamily protein